LLDGALAASSSPPPSSRSSPPADAFMIIDPVVADICSGAPSGPFRLFRDTLVCSAAFCLVFSTSSALHTHIAAPLFECGASAEN
jgi:hypothetical protein